MARPLQSVRYERGQQLRLLVLDESPVLLSVVRRVAPPDVDVETVTCIDAAVDRLRENPPDALIVNLNPTDLLWQQLQQVRAEREVPIPTLFESCIYRTAADAGIEELDDYTAFLSKPYPLTALRSRIEWLVNTAERMETGPVEPVRRDE